jgi:hypothetical protein
LLQVSDTLVPALRLPEWFNSGVAFLLIIGFPVAMVFAWAFELTPDGLRKDAGGESGRRNDKTDGRKIDFVIIGLLVVALSYLGYDKLILDPQRAFRKVQTLNPDYPNIRRDISQTYLVSGDPERALLEEWKAMPPEYGGPPSRAN